MPGDEMLGSEQRASVLIVEDDDAIREAARDALVELGYDAHAEASAEKALAIMHQRVPAAVIADVRMPGMSGIEFCKRLTGDWPEVPVLLMTAFGDVDTAVEALRAGAFDFITKPLSFEHLTRVLEQAVRRQTAAPAMVRLADPAVPDGSLSGFVGSSEALRSVIERIARVAPTQATVLITGESGTGKELVARAVHANSRRATRPFVSVNCAAISETLLESELFGHVRGAFTGAVSARKGLFEEANGGTFFFDEIAETPPSFQAKLLRAIQEGEIRRLGDNKPIHVDVRIVAATNQDLKVSIEEKRFRQDLYYRLNVARFILPPLRDRREDIPLLAEFFIDKFARKMQKPVAIGEGVMEYLTSYDFPGNIRELENMIEQGVALAMNGQIQRDDVIPPEVQLSRRAMPSGSLALDDGDSGGAGRSLQDVVDEAERKAIEAVLREVDGNKERAAEVLGLSSTTLWRKMKRLNVTWPS